MAFTLKAVESVVDVNAALNEAQQNEAGRSPFNEGDTVVFPSGVAPSLSWQNWENPDAKGKKSGRYLIVTCTPLRGGVAISGVNSIPLSSFRKKIARVCDINGSRVESPARFSNETSLTAVYNGLQGQTFTFARTEYKVVSSDGTNAEPRTISGWK